jgi:RNA polymerase sigma-70 factor (ECF subfamily)
VFSSDTAREGSEDAMLKREAREDDFESYCTRVSPSLVAQLALYTGDREDARDVVQEALLRTWREWDRVRTYEVPEAFTRRVAFNLATARWRRLRGLERVTRLLSHERSSRADGFADGLADELDLLEALCRLPAAQRQALVLHEVAGVSAEQIASEMGVRAPTVRSWLLRGRRSLARALADAPAAIEARTPSAVAKVPLSGLSASEKGRATGSSDDDKEGQP